MSWASVSFAQKWAEKMSFRRQLVTFSTCFFFLWPLSKTPSRCKTTWYDVLYVALHTFGICQIVIKTRHNQYNWCRDYLHHPLSPGRVSVLGLCANALDHNRLKIGPKSKWSMWIHTVVSHLSELRKHTLEFNPTSSRFCSVNCGWKAVFSCLVFSLYFL